MTGYRRSVLRFRHLFNLPHGRSFSSSPDLHSGRTACSYEPGSSSSKPSSMYFSQSISSSIIHRNACNAASPSDVRLITLFRPCPLGAAQYGAGSDSTSEPTEPSGVCARTVTSLQSREDVLGKVPARSQSLCTCQVSNSYPGIPPGPVKSSGDRVPVNDRETTVV